MLPGADDSGQTLVYDQVCCTPAHPTRPEPTRPESTHMIRSDPLQCAPSDLAYSQWLIHTSNAPPEPTGTMPCTIPCFPVCHRLSTPSQDHGYKSERRTVSFQSDTKLWDVDQACSKNGKPSTLCLKIDQIDFQVDGGMTCFLRGLGFWHPISSHPTPSHAVAVSSQP